MKSYNCKKCKRGELSPRSKMRMWFSWNESYANISKQTKLSRRLYEKSEASSLRSLTEI